MKTEAMLTALAPFIMLWSTFLVILTWLNPYSSHTHTTNLQPKLATEIYLCLASNPYLYAGIEGACHETGERNRNLTAFAMHLSLFFSVLWAYLVVTGRMGTTEDSSNPNLKD